jgi:hypothetical protein
MYDRPPGLSAADVRGTGAGGVKFSCSMNDEVRSARVLSGTAPQLMFPHSKFPGAGPSASSSFPWSDIDRVFR